MTPTPANIERAKQFVLAQWQARAAAGYHYPDLSIPHNLSGACKFAAVFAQQVFGGRLRANFDHTWVDHPTVGVLDLTDNVDGSDYRHDPAFARNRDFRDSLRSNQPRVERWLRAFTALSAAATVPRTQEITMTGVELKRFFKQQFGIPVRARAGKSYSEVFIVSRPRAKDAKVSDPAVYDHRFPAELGNRCMRLVYAGHQSLCEQNWGGNIGCISIAMHPDQWRRLVQSYADDAMVAAAQADADTKGGDIDNIRAADRLVGSPG